MSVGRVSLAAIYMLTFVTTLNAAALNRTSQTGQVLPADQLQPDAVEGDVQDLKVQEVNSLSSGHCYAVHFCSVSQKSSHFMFTHNFELQHMSTSLLT